MAKRKVSPHRTMIIVVTAVILLLTLIGLWQILGKENAVYNAIGFTIIMMWSAVFISYFIWATYFYNLNYGVSQAMWERLEKNKADKAAGKPYDEDMLDDEPLYNPYGDQTFGLPPGTVRGMIAFTLLFGAIALLIVSFGIKNEIAPGSFFLDQFEFFKTAFLMMVAFYFGTRGLKILKGEQAVQQLNTANAQKKVVSTGAVAPVTAPTAPTTPSAVATPSTETTTTVVETEIAKKAPGKAANLIVIDSTDPKGEKAAETTGTMPPITAIDPMAKSTQTGDQ